MKTEVTIYHLEMNDQSRFIPSARANPDFKIKYLDRAAPELNRFFYASVGKNWYWIDRLSWSDAQWKAYVDRPEMKTWIAYLGDKQAGYFELENLQGGNIEITHFGLLEEFVGMGLGGILLTRAVEQAWREGAKRVWLHTCSLDHPKALANYKARGFELFMLETQFKDLSG